MGSGEAVVYPSSTARSPIGERDTLFYLHHWYLRLPPLHAGFPAKFTVCYLRTVVCSRSPDCTGAFLTPCVQTCNQTFITIVSGWPSNCSLNLFVCRVRAQCRSIAFCGSGRTDFESGILFLCAACSALTQLAATMTQTI